MSNKLHISHQVLKLHASPSIVEACLDYMCNFENDSSMDSRQDIRKVNNKYIVHPIKAQTHEEGSHW